MTVERQSKTGNVLVQTNVVAFCATVVCLPVLMRSCHKTDGVLSLSEYDRQIRNAEVAMLNSFYKLCVRLDSRISLIRLHNTQALDKQGKPRSSLFRIRWRVEYVWN
jgi:hypothetical protein